MVLLYLHTAMAPPDPQKNATVVCLKATAAFLATHNKNVYKHMCAASLVLRSWVQDKLPNKQNCDLRSSHKIKLAAKRYTYLESRVSSLTHTHILQKEEKYMSAKFVYLFHINFTSVQEQ